MAEDQAAEARKEQLARDKEAKEKSQAEYAERMKGKPTPTQEENDRAALGEHIMQHEDDGSGPDPHVTRQMEGGRPGSYQTRHAQPRPAAPSRSSS